MAKYDTAELVNCRHHATVETRLRDEIAVQCFICDGEDVEAGSTKNTALKWFQFFTFEYCKGVAAIDEVGQLSVLFEDNGDVVISSPSGNRRCGCGVPANWVVV